MKRDSFFITLYTDASVRPKEFKTQVAWSGRCAQGTINGKKEVSYTNDTGLAELIAIREAIKYSVVKFPELEGIFINADNIEAVSCFWTFKNKKPRLELTEVIMSINALLAGRWIRAKHVKAHTGKDDVRSYMNRLVDKKTREKIKK